MKSKLYLIPSLLGNDDAARSLPAYNLAIIKSIRIFVVENEKSARKFIKTVLPEKKQQELEIHILDKNTSGEELHELSKLFKRGESIGIISEAGLPAVADPGGKLVRLAHQNQVQVIPLVGPSSILLALMASGMNGQQFMFHGYLPIDKFERKKVIQKLEADSRKNNCTQIFMETPYRNNQMLEDLIKFCQPSTSVCVAANITMDDEFILTQSIKEWAQKKTDFHKKPAIFLLES
ncbi:SAM-dependent methyltransferase [Moheibacter sp.]|uniref:SAM-dependent methyltransferase n=1 Tax=Moheibacter sp. TaxID=1965316 RepID=UPI003C72FC1B